MLHFVFGLISIREHDLSDFCREVCVGTGEGVAVPLGPCVMPWLGWAALAVTRPEALALLKEWARERMVLLLCQVILVEKGKELVLCSVWHAVKNSVVRKSPFWHCPGVFCVGAKIHGEDEFHFCNCSLKLYRDYVTVFMLTSLFWFFLHS